MDRRYRASRNRAGDVVLDTAPTIAPDVPAVLCKTLTPEDAAMIASALNDQRGAVVPWQEVGQFLGGIVGGNAAEDAVWMMRERGWTVTTAGGR